MRDVEVLNQLLFVLRTLLRIVRNDENGLGILDLVEQLIRRDDGIQRLAERDTVKTRGVDAVLERAVKDDVDAR